MQESRPDLRAGAAKVEIALPAGVRMAGYVQRVGPAQGTHDALYARAVALARGGEQMAIVSLDVLGVGEEQSGTIAHAASARTGIGCDNVLVAATHTHSGPAGIRTDERGFDPALAERVCSAAADAVELAWRSLAPAELRLGRSVAQGIGSNRHDPALPADARVRVLRIDHRSGAPLCAVVHFACHPTVLNHENLLLSGDLVGLAMEALQDRLGAPALFLNGAAGDTSTRFVRRAATFSEAERFAHMLAAAAREAWEAAEPQAVTRLAVGRRRLALAARQPLPAEAVAAIEQDAEQRLRSLQAGPATHGELRRLQALLEGVKALRLRDCPGRREPVEATIQALRLGNVVVVGVPAELYTATARAIEEAAGSSGREVLVVGYANGYIGYIPDEEPGTSPSYEGLVSRLAPGAAGQIVLAIREMIENLCVE